MVLVALAVRFFQILVTLKSESINAREGKNYSLIPSPYQNPNGVWSLLSQIKEKKILHCWVFLNMDELCTPILKLLRYVGNLSCVWWSLLERLINFYFKKIILSLLINSITKNILSIIQKNVLFSKLMLHELNAWFSFQWDT